MTHFTLFTMMIFIISLPMIFSIFTLKHELTIPNYFLSVSNVRICGYYMMPLYTINSSLYLWEKEIISGAFPQIKLMSCSQDVDYHDKDKEVLMAIFQSGKKASVIKNFLFKITNESSSPVLWNPFLTDEETEIFRVYFSQKRFSVRIIKTSKMYSEIHIFEMASFERLAILTFPFEAEPSITMDVYGSVFILEESKKLTIFYGNKYVKNKTIDLTEPELRIEKIEQLNYNHTKENTTKIIIHYYKSNLYFDRNLYITYNNNEIEILLENIDYNDKYFTRLHCGDRIFESDLQKQCYTENKLCIINETFGSLLCVQEHGTSKGNVKILIVTNKFLNNRPETILRYFEEIREDDETEGSLSALMIILIIAVSLVIALLLIYAVFKINKKRKEKKIEISKEEKINDDNYSQLSE